MSTNETFQPSFDTCDDVSDLCPVEITLYGDYFSTVGCVVFVIGFALCFIWQIYCGLRLRPWSFMIYLFIGTGFELVGYLARTVMSYNPWVFAAFAAQLMLLVLGPTFIAAAISVTFKHLVIHFDPTLSPIRPSFYPWIFVGSDFISIVIQGAGAAIAGAATAGENPDETLMDLANALLIAGVSFQVANMVICGLFMIYYWRRYKSSHRRIQSPVVDSQFQFQPPQHLGGKTGLRHDRVKLFIYAITAAYIAVLIRCIYRIPEMTSGWGSSLMQSEPTFLVFDGAMILTSVILLTVFHPWFFFKQIKDKYKNTGKGNVLPLR
jgi:hypothetical protein